MNIHKKIIVLVGFGLLLMMTLVVLSLQNVMTAFSSLTGETGRVSGEMQRVELVSKELAGMVKNLNYYITSKDGKYREAYRTSRNNARSQFAEFEKHDSKLADQRLIETLRSYLNLIEGKADRLFLLHDPMGLDSGRAHTLLLDVDGLLEWATKDIETHFKDEQEHQMDRIAGYVQFVKRRVLLLFVTILLLSIGFLLAFGIFMHRKVAVPLNELWKGTTQISRGNFDYQMQLQGTTDIGLLAERFNEMAQQLRQSYTELEKKLFDRTNELTAIDSVALTLSQSGSLKVMLSKSLGQILNSLAGLDPKGGIFLSDPNGETLRLVASQGLSAEFVQSEATIKMGECLCGVAAQTGEIIYAENGCEDPRHTHGTGERSHIIIPIKSRGTVLGVIFLYPRENFALKPSDLQMLDTIGAQLGLAVENQRFYAEVKDSSEKYWDLFENSRDILFTMDSAGMLTAVNRAAEKFTGHAKSELVGKSVLDFLTPEGIEIAQRMFADKGVTTREVIEFEVVKRDGSRAYIEMSARKLKKKRMHTGFQISARDMTDQKLMREKLLKAERLGAIGEVVITVRHEINNPLTTVIGNVELLLERFGEQDKDLKKRLEAVLNNSLRIAEIVQKLQAIKRDKVVEYVRGVTMTDLKQE